ncbi:MAG TPA: 50S ribosomal protein L30 [Archaeoglobaceae archaeon]|nr:50S ribosomal protein L30 [Archaeoglobaceae archaeon]
MFAVVRLRGEVGVSRKIRDTLSMLRLHKINHCVLVPDTPSYRGMLHIVKDYVAFGEVKPEVLSTLLRKRGKLVGNKPITDEYIKENTDFNSVEELSRAIVEGKINLDDIPEIKPVLRLHPPRGGLKNIKWQYSRGELGYQGENINKLLYKMR